MTLAHFMSALRELSNDMRRRERSSGSGRLRACIVAMP